VKTAEITGKIGVHTKIDMYVEHETDAAAGQCVSLPLFDFVDLMVIERVRQHVINGHDGGKHLSELTSVLTEQVGEVAKAVNEFIHDQEVGAFETLQIELVGLGAKAAHFFEQTWAAGRVAVDAGVSLPHLSIAPEAEGEPLTIEPSGAVAPHLKPIIAFTGGRGAGKDSVAKHLIEKHGFAKGSFAAPLKRLVAAEYGFDLERLEELDYKEEFVPELGLTRRELLIKVGTEWFRSIDPMHWIKRSAPDFKATLVDPNVKGLAVTDLRFENELAELRRLFPTNPVIVIRVVRSDSPLPPNADDAINAWKTIPADVVFEAEYGQLPLLYAKADQLMQMMETEGEAQ